MNASTSLGRLIPIISAVYCEWHGQIKRGRTAEGWVMDMVSLLEMPSQSHIRNILSTLQKLRALMPTVRFCIIELHFYKVLMAVETNSRVNHYLGLLFVNVCTRIRSSEVGLSVRSCLLDEV